MLVSVVLVLLMSVAALSIDGGHLYQTRRKMQTAADSAAEAGAIELFTNYELNRGVDSNGKARASALSLASAHGYGVSGSTVDINIPPASGVFRGKAGYVEAIITSRMPPSFSRVFGRSELMARDALCGRGHNDSEQGRTSDFGAHEKRRTETEEQECFARSRWRHYCQFVRQEERGESRQEVSDQG